MALSRPTHLAKRIGHRACAERLRGRVGGEAERRGSGCRRVACPKAIDRGRGAWRSADDQAQPPRSFCTAPWRSPAGGDATTIGPAIAVVKTIRRAGDMTAPARIALHPMQFLGERGITQDSPLRHVHRGALSADPSTGWRARVMMPRNSQGPSTATSKDSQAAPFASRLRISCPWSVALYVDVAIRAPGSTAARFRAQCRAIVATLSWQPPRCSARRSCSFVVDSRRTLRT
jgi:hypothetical protein